MNPFPYIIKTSILQLFVIPAILLFYRLYSNKIRYNWRILPAIFLIILSIDIIPINYVIKKEITIPSSQPPIETTIGKEPTNSNIEEPSPTNKDIVDIELFNYVWIIGVATLAIWNIHSYQKQKKQQELIRKPIIYKKIKVYEDKNCNIPYAYGILHKRIIVPPSFEQQEEQNQLYILEHEYLHFKLHHLQLLFVLKLLSIIYWFQPLLWVFIKKVKEQMELSVDETLIRQFTWEEKKGYIQCLLMFVSKVQGPQEKLSFTQSKMKKRVLTILEEKEMKQSRKVLLMIMVFVLCACNAVNVKEEIAYVNDEQEEEVTKVERRSDVAGLSAYLEQNNTVTEEDLNSGVEELCYHPRGEYKGANGEKVYVWSHPHPYYHIKVEVIQQEEKKEYYLPNGTVDENGSSVGGNGVYEKLQKVITFYGFERMDVYQTKAES